MRDQLPPAEHEAVVENLWRTASSSFCVCGYPKAENYPLCLNCRIRLQSVDASRPANVVRTHLLCTPHIGRREFGDNGWVKMEICIDLLAALGTGRYSPGRPRKASLESPEAWT